MPIETTPSVTAQMENHDDLLDMPDILGVNTDHDPRYGGALWDTTTTLKTCQDHIADLANPHVVTLVQLGVTASAAELNILDGATITTAELNILTGLTATVAELNLLDLGGMVAGWVLIATGAATAAWAQLQHGDLGGVGANDHHSEIHAIPGAHTFAGLTIGHVLRASAANAAIFAQLQHGDLGGVGVDDHHAQAHDIEGADHTAAGLTIGHYMRATAANAFAFQAIGAGDLPAHTHDLETLQLDAVDSNGGAFPFDTTGLVTFNNSVLSDGYIQATTSLIAGVNDTSLGRLYLYGPSAGDGGGIAYLFLSDAHDLITDFFYISAWEDDLLIGTDDGGAFLTLTRGAHLTLDGSLEINAPATLDKAFDFYQLYTASVDGSTGSYFERVWTPATNPIVLTAIYGHTFNLSGTTDITAGGGGLSLQYVRDLNVNATLTSDITDTITGSWTTAIEGVYGGATDSGGDVSTQNNTRYARGLHFAATATPTLNKAAGTLTSYCEGILVTSSLNPVITAGTFVGYSRGINAQAVGTNEGTQTVQAVYGWVSGSSPTSYAAYLEKNIAAQTTPTVFMLQDSLTGACPVLSLQQDDISEGFIDFLGSDRGVILGATDSVESVRIELGGVVRRIAIYADA